MTKKTRFLAAVLLQAAILLAVFGVKYVGVATGTDVVLQIKPVDPRDPLRGDYVTFQYNISDLDSYQFRGNQVERGDTVYVSLQQTPTAWFAGGAATTRPSEGVFIRGKVTSVTNLSPKYEPGETVPGQWRAHIEYGAEQYFIPEGRGRTLNSAIQEAMAVVSVDKNGSPVLKKIYVDGKRWP